MNHSEIVSFIWSVADLIRDSFKRGHYQDVILPLTVLRRLDCVLAPTREAVWHANAKYKGKLDNPYKQLCRASGFAFYNTSLYDFEKLLGDHAHLAKNLRNYIAGFSPNMVDVLENFGFDNTINELEKAKLLYKVLERFKNVDLHPDKVSNAQMGTIFEELIRKFNEALDENPGEHFTPRDVVHLMVGLLLAGDDARLKKPGVVLTVCDPCCGTGGMLTITKEHIEGDGRPGINPKAEVHLFGQEVNPQTFAVCKSDLFMKSADGEDAEHVLFGSTLSEDKHAGRRFDYLIANPPYGKDWEGDQEAVKAEHERGEAGRFAAGLPRKSDGQLLFLQHMLAHMKPSAEGGSRVAIIMNGSPLFTATLGAARRRSAAGSSRTTGSRRSWRCPSRCSITPGSRRTYGCSRTGKRRSVREKSSSLTPRRSGRRCARALATSGARFRPRRRRRSWRFIRHQPSGSTRRSTLPAISGTARSPWSGRCASTFRRAPSESLGSRLNRRSKIWRRARRNRGPRSTRPRRRPGGRGKRRSGSCSPACPESSSRTGNSSWGCYCRQRMRQMSRSERP
jgi:type I restriction-modification system DNA methylase subunit